MGISNLCRSASPPRFHNAVSARAEWADFGFRWRIELEPSDSQPEGLRFSDQTTFDWMLCSMLGARPLRSEYISRAWRLYDSIDWSIVVGRHIKTAKLCN